MNRVMSVFRDICIKKPTNLPRMTESKICIACENIRFSSLFAAGDVSRGSSVRNVPSDEERGETDVFAG